MDTETGLHYNYFRFYAPDLEKYLQADPIGLHGDHLSHLSRPAAWVKMDPRLILLMAPIILLAYATEVSLGFGAALVAVAMGSQFYPLDQLVPVLALLNVLVTSYVTLRHRRLVDWRLILRRLFPGMILGAALGLALFPLIDIHRQKQFYLLAVGLFALFQLARRQGRGRTSSAGTRLDHILPVLAGVAQALYSTGGPFLVLAVGRLPLDKGQLRATLCAVWLGINSLLTTFFALSGRLNAANLQLAAYLAPLLPLGALAGELLHRWIPELYFRHCLWWLLLATAGLGLIGSR